MSFWRKLRRFTRRAETARDLEDEIRFHLAEEERLRLDRGEPAQSARDSARRAFGNVQLVKEVTRQMWGWHSIEIFVQDLFYALRQLRRSPGFTLTAVATLALGIGVNTAVFSIVNSVLLRPLPVSDPNSIVTLTIRQGDLFTQFSYPDFDEIRSQSTGVFSDLFGYTIGMEGLMADGKSSHLWTNFVTGNYFAALGLRPALGRFILPSEGSQAGGDPVLVLGNDYWKADFQADPNVVGRKVMLNGHPVTIVGVAPAEFHGLYSVIDSQGFLPSGMQAIEADAGDFLHDRAIRNLRIFGRLRPGVTLRQAQASLSVIAAGLAREHPHTDQGMAVRVFPEREARPDPDASGSVPMIAALFLALTGIVLLLACINVMNILLVRASVRQREMAVRSALGAGRLRLMRQLATESLLLALFGGIGGVLLGIVACRSLGSLPLKTPIPFLLDFQFDWNVFVFAIAIALAAGAIVGLVPAMRASRADIADVLRSGGRTISAGRHRLRGALVVVQVAGSLMLLIAAALFTKSLGNAQRVDLGFDPDHVVNITLDANEAGYTEVQAQQFYKTLLDHVRALPGVESASLAFSVPMSYYDAANGIRIPDYQPKRGEGSLAVSYDVVTPGYFTTMRIPLLRGRAFTEADTEKSQHVAVINQAMAERYWPGRDAIGRELVMMDDAHNTYRVIGIARNIRERFRDPIQPFVYVPLAQLYSSIETLQARTTGSPQELLPQLEKTIATLAPGMPVFDAQTMTEALNTFNGLLRYKIGAILAAALGLLGLVLAVVGLYGVVSYAAAQRTHEIGIRMALGAGAGKILAMIVGQGIVLVSIGLALGILAAFGLARVMSRFLVGVSGIDPLVYGAVTLLLALVAVAACYIPARRATRVDPLSALRVE